MIRPITIVTFLMACGSGLYLYQSKHEVQLLDRTIEKSVRDTTALREQSRLLSAEWTMLNDPERLRQFSDTYLSLKSINPAQFTSLTDLDNRLPAPQIETPAPAPVETPIAAADQPSMDGDESDDADTAPTATAAASAVAAEPEAMPLPPIPTARPPQVATSAPHPTEAKVAIARPPVVADVKPAEPRPAEPRTAPRLAEVRPEPRVAEPRAPEARTPEPRAQMASAPKPIVLPSPRAEPAYTPRVAAAAPVAAPFRPAPAPAPVSSFAPAQTPYSGSLLGAARNTAPPAPRPMPVNATYNAN